MGGSNHVIDNIRGNLASPVTFNRLSTTISAPQAANVFFLELQTKEMGIGKVHILKQRQRHESAVF